MAVVFLKFSEQKRCVNTNNWKARFCLLLTIALLSGYGGKEAGPSSEAVPLTEEQIAQANEALSATREEDGILYSTEISCFFTSYYDRVEELDFENFLRYFPTSEYVEDEDGDEFAALSSLPEFPQPRAEQLDNGQRISVDLAPVPVHRIREEDVNAALTKWAGITLDDISSKNGAPYLEDYHAFYTFTSDFGPGQFICTSGEVEGDTARLWSGSTGESKTQNLLTLVQKDGNWLISSFQNLPAVAEK